MNNMTGSSVYKPSHQSKNLPWRAEVWFRNSKNDKKHYLSKNFRSKKEALAWRDNEIKRYKNKRISSDPDVTLSDWLNYSLSHFFINLRPSTKTSYEGYFRNKIGKHEVGDIKLVDLNSCDLQEFINYMLLSLSPKTVRSLILAVRKSLHFAVGAGIIDKNPADYIVLPKCESNEVEFLTVDEVQALSKAASGEDWKVFFNLGFMTGCRIGELAALRKSSLRFENDQFFLRIEGSLSRVTDYENESVHATVLKIGPTKSEKSRDIPLLPNLVSEIQFHFQRQQELAIQLYGKPVEDPFMFSCDGGLHFVDPSTIRTWSQRVASRAGITKKFHPHMLRKSLATVGSNCSGLNIKDMSEILGNGFQVCADHYVASTLATKTETIKQLQPLCEQLFS